MATVTEQLTTWAHAERTGDASALESVLHPDFLAVGPYGFLLDREQWLQRFSGGLQYTAFEFTPDTDVRYIGGSALVIGTQTHQGTHAQQAVDGSFRVTLVFTGDPQWQLAAVHLSLRTPPAAPDDAAAAA
ncbi:nuclear transport factor 2 family protein [Streptomyces sp. NPDC004059]